jgi:hypothetical protein
MMLTSITITSTASLSTSTNPRPQEGQNHGMQQSGGGEVSREINVNSRRPLIPIVTIERGPADGEMPDGGASCLTEGPVEEEDGHACRSGCDAIW